SWCRRRAMLSSYAVRWLVLSSSSGWAMRVTRGICRVWRRSSSASRVAVARRCSSLASCAAATVRASRRVIGVLAVLEDEDVAVGVGDGEGGAVFHGGNSFFVEVAGGLAEVV